MQHLWLIPALPLLGFLINGLVGRRLPKAVIHTVAVGTVALAFVWVLKTVIALQPLATPHIERYFDWMFVGWEGVGLCSYLLIGFWFLKKSATNAANKAFIVNRIGDFGFSLAIFLL